MAKKVARKRKRRVFSNEEKRIFYHEWLRGYSYPHPENVHASRNEYERAKKTEKLDPVTHSWYKGEIAGYQAQLDDQKKGIYNFKRHNDKY